MCGKIWWIFINQFKDKKFSSLITNINLNNKKEKLTRLEENFLSLINEQESYCKKDDVLFRYIKILNFEDFTIFIELAHLLPEIMPKFCEIFFGSFTEKLKPQVSENSKTSDKFE